MNFKEWMEKRFSENLWGNVPSKKRKPSDGWGGNRSAPAAPMQGMMKKAMKK